MPRLVRFVIAVVGCLAVVAGVLMPLGVSARPGGSVLTAATKPIGTLEVTVNRSGTYTVSGQGVRKRADKSRTFDLAPGVYTVTAADATVTPKKVRVWTGETSRVTVAFHGVPDLASALATGGGPCVVLQDEKVGCWQNELWPTPKTVKGITNPRSTDRNGDSRVIGVAT